MRPLQAGHGACFAKDGSALQWYYISKKCPVACVPSRIYIIGHTKRDVTATFSAIERESTKMGLENEGKTKYMLSTRREAY